MLCYEDIAIGVSSVSLFHRNKNNIFFDEDFGMGAKFNSSEEFDYVLSLMQRAQNYFFLMNIRFFTLTVLALKLMVFLKEQV